MGASNDTLLTGFVGGVAAWFCTELIAKPLIRFADMRRELTRCLVVYGNVPTRAQKNQAGEVSGFVELSAGEQARLSEAQKAYRDLSGRMHGFANVDHVANWIVKAFGYDPGKAAAALLGLSNELPMSGMERAHYHDEVRNLLRIHSL